jgi:putative ABC transport system permease protein
MQDIRYAGRVLFRAPGFTAAAVMVLALGIGANSAIFSVIDAAQLRPLPFLQPGELVVLWEKPPGKGLRRVNRVSTLNFLDWHDQNRVFTGLAAVSGASVTLTARDGAELIAGQAVTREFFSVLGVRPIAGRTFNEEDERTKANVVVLSENLWRSHFATDLTLIGRTIPLDGLPYTVIGIVPARFQVFYAANLWKLYVAKRSPEQRAMHYLQVVERLRPGVSLEQAGAAMAGIADGIARISPATNKDWGVHVETLREALVGSELRTTALVLGGAVVFVLLMACANVANLMLARGASRIREMAVRVALGANRGRLARQLLAESLLLAAMGGACGLALSWALVRVAERVIPAETIPVGIAISLNARVAAFTAAVTLVTGVLFGMAPVWQLTRELPGERLRTAGRGVSGGHSRVLGGLVIAEIAIAVLVVTGAGLFLRTLDRLAAVDPGYHAEHVLTARLVLPLARYGTPERALTFYREAQRELESLPGVRSAAFGGSLPLTGWDIGQGFRVKGDAKIGESRQAAAHYQIVGARYFETLGIPLLFGRAFDDRDGGGGRQVAIVNQEFVRKYLQGREPVGAHLSIQAMDMKGPTPVDREIVGVVGQVKVDGLGEKENAVEVYVPITQNPWFSASVALRTTGDPLTMAGALRAAVARVDKELALTGVRSMDEIAGESAARPRFRARLLGGFALLALVLGAVGIFGVLAFSVSQRRREFGIRMAVGAQAGDVLSLVIMRGLKLAAAGIALGLAGATLVSQSASGLLFGVEPLDPAAYGVAAAVLAAVALAAAVVPAWRAARVDPAVTLREE